MRKTFIAASVALAALGSGCATTTADGLAAETHVAGFDGATVVSIRPHGAVCASLGACPAIGANWDSKDPGSAIMPVALFNDIVGITSAQISIGDAVHRLTPTAGITQFTTVGRMLKSSEKDFVIPMSTVRALAQAERAWLRVGTPGGYVDAAIINAGEDSRALHAMRRFLAAVDATGKAEK